MARTFDYQTVVELAKHSTVPVINGLTNFNHPCQALADLYTIKQKKGLKGKIVFLGDGANNTFHSLIRGCEKFEMDVVVSCPSNYRPKIEGNYRIVENPQEAVKGADILYTDVFVSMGEEAERQRRLKELIGYQLNSKLVKLAKNDVIVMHPMPIHRGVEITADVADSDKSVILLQAENRLHTEKALLVLLMKEW
jgi:ornithine carbamoyltransferase